MKMVLSDILNYEIINNSINSKNFKNPKNLLEIKEQM